MKAASHALLLLLACVLPALSLADGFAAGDTLYVLNPDPADRLNPCAPPRPPQASVL